MQNFGWLSVWALGLGAKFGFVDGMGGWGLGTGRNYIAFDGTILVGYKEPFRGILRQAQDDADVVGVVELVGDSKFTT